MAWMGNYCSNMSVTLWSVSIARLPKGPARVSTLWSCCICAWLGRNWLAGTVVLLANSEQEEQQLHLVEQCQIQKPQPSL